MGKKQIKSKTPNSQHLQKTSQSFQYDLCECSAQELVLNLHFPVIKCRRGCNHFQGLRLQLDTLTYIALNCFKLWHLHFLRGQNAKG